MILNNKGVGAAGELSKLEGNEKIIRLKPSVPWSGGFVCITEEYILDLTIGIVCIIPQYLQQVYNYSLH